MSFASDAVFALLEAGIKEDGANLVKKIKGIYGFKVTEGPGGATKEWTIDLKNGVGSVKAEKGLFFFLLLLCVVVCGCVFGFVFVFDFLFFFFFFFLILSTNKTNSNQPTKQNKTKQNKTKQNTKKKKIAKADVTLTLSDANFVALADGKANAQQLFMQGKIKMQGNMYVFFFFVVVVGGGGVVGALRIRRCLSKKKKTD